MAFAKLKAMLRSAAKRTVADLWDVVRTAFAAFKLAECRNDITAAGYDAYDPIRSDGAQTLPLDHLVGADRGEAVADLARSYGVSPINRTTA